jgi:hypothetical protein
MERVAKAFAPISIVAATAEFSRVSDLKLENWTQPR